MSIAKHSLSLSLDNKKWFKYASFKERDSLTEQSCVSLKTLWGLSTLSFGMELLFALLVLVLAAWALYYPYEVKPLIALIGLLSCFLIIFFTKRILIFAKYGRRKSNEIVISKDSITIAGTGLRKTQKGSVTINRSDIKEVIVSYTYRDKRHRHTRDLIHISRNGARLMCMEVVTADGQHYVLDGMRIAYYNLLYLLIFFDYPLQYIRSASGGMQVIFILLIRGFSLAAFGNAIIFTLSKMPNPFQ